MKFSLILLFSKNDHRIEESFLSIQIPSNLNYQITSTLEKYYQMIRSNIKDKNRKFEFEFNSANTPLSSNFKVFNDGSVELLSFVHMKLEKDQQIVSEICAKVENIYNFDKNSLGLKSIKTFVLKSLREEEYPDYGLILSLLWANSATNLSNGIEYLNCKRSDLIKNSLYKYIYYIEYQTLINSTAYSFMYGVTNENENIFIRSVILMQNNVLIPKKTNKNYKFGNVAFNNYSDLK